MKLRSTWSAVLVAGLLPVTSHADSGFYIGASAGGATLEAELGDTGIPEIPSKIDEDDNAIKGFVGYKFDLPALFLAVEGGYVDFGEAEVDTTLGEIVLDTTGINLWGVAGFEAGPIDIFGKLGVVAWDVDASLLDQRASDDGTDLGYGLGLSFGIGPVDIRGEYEIYDLDDADLSMLSLGISYRFN